MYGTMKYVPNKSIVLHKIDVKIKTKHIASGLIELGRYLTRGCSSGG